MKTSVALASILFGTLALSAPVDRRALVTKTEVVVETQIVYVTVWDEQAPIPEPTTTPAGLFYEQPAPKSTVEAKPTSAVYQPPQEEPKPSSSSVPPVPTPSSVKEEPTPVYTPPPPPPAETTPAPVKEEPAPVYTPVEQPKPSPSPALPVLAPVIQPPKEEPSGGDAHVGELTQYDAEGASGACGRKLSDSKYTAAISAKIWGADVWGSADNINGNAWCGKQVQVSYGGKIVTVEIQDKCMGCEPGDIDVTKIAWDELTDGAYPSRVKASWA